MSEERKETFKLIANYSHVGLTFSFSILIGFGGGILLDQKFFGGRTSPWFTLIGFVIGIVAGYKTLLELLLMVQDDASQQEKNEWEKH